MKCYIKSKILLYILLVILSLGFCLTKSENASAYDFTFIAEAVNDSGGEPYCRALITDDTTSSWTNWDVGNFPTLGGNTGNGVAINSIQCKHIADDVRIEELQYVEMVIRIKTDAFHPSSQYYQNTGYFTTTLTGPRYINDGWFRGVYAEQIGVEENYNERYEYWRLVTRYSEHGWVNYVEAPFRIFNNSVQSPMTVRVFSWTIWKPRDLLTGDDRTFLEALLEEHTSQESFSEALENSKDEEREELEDKQDEASDAGDDAQEDVENGTSSLTETIGQVVTTIKNAQPTNCNVTINPRANQFELGTINLCNAPQSIRNTIQTVVVIAVTLGVFRTAYTIFNQFMYYVRREQE